MDQICANTPAPIKANLMTELLNVHMSWANGGCTRAGSPGDTQTRDFGPWDARRSRAMMRANAWGHDEIMSIKLAGLDLAFALSMNHGPYLCAIKKAQSILDSIIAYFKPNARCQGIYSHTIDPGCPKQCIDLWWKELMEQWNPHTGIISSYQDKDSHWPTATFS